MFNVLGTMSGTSFDGLDLSYVCTDGDNFLKVDGSAYVHYTLEIKNRLYSFSQSTSVIDMLLLERDITLFYGEAINDFIQKYRFPKPDYIAFHGQTLLHSPQDAISLQVGCPILLSKICETHVINDFRTNDIVYGGQGAPITPIYHVFLTKNYQKPLAVINIGGISNITFISEKGEIKALDSGPGTGLIDEWVNMHDPNMFYDEDGNIAKSGNINHEILDEFFTNDYFKITSVKSLDKRHFNVAEMCVGLSLEDGCATLVEFTVMAIKKAFDMYVTDDIKNVFLCGGGRKNLVLKNRIHELLGLDVLDIDVTGHDGDYVEAESMAYIAARAINGLDFTFPNTTGVIAPQGSVRCTHYKKNKKIDVAP